MTKSMRFSQPLGIMGRLAGRMPAPSSGRNPHETAAFVSRTALAPPPTQAGATDAVFAAICGGFGYQAPGEPAGAVVGQCAAAGAGADAERQREFGDLGRAW